MSNVEQNTTSYPKVDVFSDGGSRGNPGKSASGYVILTTDETVLETGGEYLGIATNNQAEYQAVRLALEQAKKYSPLAVRFFIDSELVVKQLNGEYKIKNNNLWPIYEAIKKLMKEFPSVTFTHVRREQNTLADKEVNRILDDRI